MSHNYQIIVPRIREGRIRMWWPILMRLWRRVAKMICRMMMMIILRRRNLLLRRHRWSPNVSMRKYFHYPRWIDFNWPSKNPNKISKDFWHTKYQSRHHSTTGHCDLKSSKILIWDWFSSIVVNFLKHFSKMSNTTV